MPFRLVWVLWLFVGVRNACCIVKTGCQKRVLNAIMGCIVESVDDMYISTD